METALFVFAKLVGAFTKVETWLVLALGLIVLALARGRWHLARRAAVGVLAFLLVLSIVPLGDLAVRPFERAYPVAPPLQRVDGIVVLGGGTDAAASALWTRPQLGVAGDRFTEALLLARRFPGAPLVFTGGSGRLRDLGGIATTEASVAARFFLEQGLAEDRLIVEDRSRNTVENARRTHALVDPEPAQVWVLVTSAYHMRRSMARFAQAGWPEMVPWPTDYRSRPFADGIGWDLARNLGLLNVALREAAGHLALRAGL